MTGSTPAGSGAPARKPDGAFKIVADFVSVLTRNFQLIREMAVRDLKGGLAAHGLGVAWAFVQPLVIVTTYLLIFGAVIGGRLTPSAELPGDYASYVLVGLTPWLLTSNALGRAPNAFSSNANLVKQVVFPIETLPVASMLACFVLYAPVYALMLAYRLTIGGGLAPLALCLPIIVAMHAILALGVTLLLSVTTPFVRDLRELVTMYLSVSMYFTPAIYLPDWVPAPLRPLLYANPFSYVVWVYQDVLYFGEIRHGFAWVAFALMSVGAFWGGLIVFRRVKPYLGNVL